MEVCTELLELGSAVRWPTESKVEPGELRARGWGVEGRGKPQALPTSQLPPSKRL